MCYKHKCSDCIEQAKRGSWWGEQVSAHYDVKGEEGRGVERRGGEKRGEEGRGGKSG